MRIAQSSTRVGGLIRDAALAVFLCLLALAPYKALADFSGRVTWVADGDTIEVVAGGAAVRVRLEGIDAPELDQPFGVDAKVFVQRYAGGQVVTVLEKGRDRYGRTLGDVILPNGDHLNRRLVEEGLAWHYKRYSRDAALAALEQRAQVRRIGLWGQSAPMPPWEWRRR